MKKNLLCSAIIIAIISFLTISCKKENSVGFHINTATNNLISDTPYRPANAMPDTPYRTTSTTVLDTPYRPATQLYTDTPYLHK